MGTIPRDRIPPCAHHDQARLAGVGALGDAECSHQLKGRSTECELGEHGVTLTRSAGLGSVSQRCEPSRWAQPELRGLGSNRWGWGWEARKTKAEHGPGGPLDTRHGMWTRTLVFTGACGRVPINLTFLTLTFRSHVSFVSQNCHPSFSVFPHHS